MCIPMSWLHMGVENEMFLTTGFMEEDHAAGTNNSSPGTDRAAFVITRNGPKVLSSLPKIYPQLYVASNHDLLQCMLSEKKSGV